MPIDAVGRMMEEQIGLSPEHIGTQVLNRVVQRRSAHCGVPDRQAYLNLLRTSSAELQTFIDEIVVPETWFFRLRRSFDFLYRYALSYQKGPIDPEGLFALSIPSSTGEEAYSMAMTFLEAGLDGNDFRVHAVDVSQRTIQQATQGMYALSSLRGMKDSDPMRAYFVPRPPGLEVQERVRRTVTFTHGNLLDPSSFGQGRKYQIIFCRNLMIYFSQQARAKAMSNLKQMLTPDGLLFIGHVERPIFEAHGFSMLGEKGAFVCTRTRTAPVRSRQVSLSSDGKRKNAQAVFRPPKRRFRVQAVRKTVNKPPIPARQQTSAAPQVATADNTESKPRSLLDEAWQLADQGNLGEALNSCRLALEHTPTLSQAHFLMGLLRHAMDDVETAKQDFQKVLYLDPKHCEALDYLIVIAEAQGREDTVCRLRKRREMIVRQESVRTGPDPEKHELGCNDDDRQ